MTDLDCSKYKIEQNSYVEMQRTINTNAENEFMFVVNLICHFLFYNLWH